MFITFIDDHTWVCWVYLLKEKIEATQIFENFLSMVKNQFQTFVEVLCSDNIREYFISMLGNFLLKQGIIHQSSCTNTFQQNHVAKWKNRHPVEVACAFMFTNNVPTFFLGQCHSRSMLSNKLCTHQSPPASNSSKHTS